jgi:hypothetical protein
MHLVSSQIPHIYYFIIYLYSKTTIVLCNILNSQIAGNIFVNEQCHRKLMFSRDIEFNPGPAFILFIYLFYLLNLILVLYSMLSVKILIHFGFTH